MGEETGPGEAEGLDRFLFFLGGMSFWMAVFGTVIIDRIASVNRANSGSVGGVFMKK